MSVFVYGNYAYVASYGSDALEIVDVTDPTVPIHRCSITNGMLNAPYSANWSSVGNASGYSVDVFTTSDFSSIVNTKVVTGGSTTSTSCIDTKNITHNITREGL